MLSLNDEEIGTLHFYWGNLNWFNLMGVFTNNNLFYLGRKWFEYENFLAKFDILKSYLKSSKSFETSYKKAIIDKRSI